MFQTTNQHWWLNPLFGSNSYYSTLIMMIQSLSCTNDISTWVYHCWLKSFFNSNPPVIPIFDANSSHQFRSAKLSSCIKERPESRTWRCLEIWQGCTRSFCVQWDCSQMVVKKINWWRCSGSHGILKCPMYSIICIMGYFLWSSCLIDESP